MIQTTVVIFFYRFWFLPLPNHPAEYAQMQQRFILSFPALKIWIKCTCSPIVIHPGDLSTCVFRKNMQKMSNLNTCDNLSHSCQADDTNARAKHTKCCHVWQMMDLTQFHDPYIRIGEHLYAVCNTYLTFLTLQIRECLAMFLSL